MPITANANYQDPQMGAIVSNLAAAIYGDPEARMKAGYYGAESANANASAAKSNAETDGLKIKNAASANLPAIAQAFVPLPGETSDQHFARVGPVLGQLLQAGGGNADDIAKGLNTGISSIFAQGGVDDQARSLTMQGHPVDQNFAPTTARADEVSARNAKQAKDQAVSVANIDQSGATTRTGMEDKNKLDLLFAQPITPKAGEKTYLSPNDPRAKTMGTNGVIQGAPTYDTVRGQAGADILALPAGTAPSSNIADVFSGKAGDAAAPKPKAVNAKALQGAIVTGVKSLNGVVDPANPQASAENFAAFESTFPPDQIAAAHDAANKVLAATGNANDAGAAYLTSLGLKPGDTFHNPGALHRLFGGTPGMDKAPAAPIAQTVAPAAAAAPAPVTRDQLPPPAQRKVGMTVPTPKGDMTWTLQGWVPAGKTY